MCSCHHDVTFIFMVEGVRVGYHRVCVGMWIRVFVVIVLYHHLYLHGGGCKGGEFLGHALGDAREHGGGCLGKERSWEGG